MKKKAILVAALAALSIFAIKNHNKKKQNWFTIENIDYNEELHMISGTCTEGPYLGEVEVYLPDFIQEKLENGSTVQVQAEAVTMSLPPQLIQVKKLKKEAQN